MKRRHFWSYKCAFFPQEGGYTVYKGKEKNVKWPEVVSSTKTPLMGDEKSVWKTKACCNIEIECNILGQLNEYYWLLQSEHG